MLDYLWAAMIAFGVVWGLMTGKAEALTEGVLTGAKDAVTMSITMLGIMSAWTGVMKIAENSGIIKSISEKLKPFMRFMFPGIEDTSSAYGPICTNIVANILGLGWAATPAGLKSMEELAKHEKEKNGGITDMKAASDEMCTFLVLNISSLQLIPINIIAYRSQYGSVNPAAIVVPAIIATTVSTLSAIVYCKMKMKKRNNNFKKTAR